MAKRSSIAVTLILIVVFLLAGARTATLLSALHSPCTSHIDAGHDPGLLLDRKDDRLAHLPPCTFTRGPVLPSCSTTVIVTASRSMGEALPEFVPDPHLPPRAPPTAHA